MKYSYCTTVYNSSGVIGEFLNFMSKHLDSSSELVIVDNYSIDGTYETLRTFANDKANVSIIQKKCTRGTGRQTAIENSNGQIIIMLDADGIYRRIVEYLNELEFNNGKILLYSGTFNGSRHYCVLGTRKTFKIVGSYPDLNYLEDTYYYSIAEALGVLVKRTMNEGDVLPLKVMGQDSGTESRYAGSSIEAVRRRAIATRDILFVEKFNLKQLCDYYKLKGTAKFTTCLPLFILGKFLRFTIKDEPLDLRLKRCEMLKKDHF